MHISHKYNLQFSKTHSEAKGITYQAEAFGGSADLAAYLTQTNLAEAVEELKDHPETGDVKIGDTILPSKDFKTLLQEWVEHIQPLSLENEIAKLRKYLMLPITDIELDDRTELGVSYVNEDHEFLHMLARVYIGDVYIGDLPYRSNPFGLMYNLTTDLLNWPKIAEIYHDELLAQIIKKEPLAVSFRPGLYGMLMVLDAGGKFIKQAFCNYQDDHWRVGVSGLDGKVVSETVSVKMKVPPPPVLDIIKENPPKE